MIRRRHSLAGLASAAFLSTMDRLNAGPQSSSKTSRSLVPPSPCKAPNYWCTWAVQNYMFGQGLDQLDPAVLEGESGSKLAHNAMSEQALFGKRGWANDFYPRLREDLFLLLDNGWEAGGTATFELESSRFPSYHGTPSDKLSQLNNAAQSAGWRGAALWCRNTPGDGQDARLEQWSKSAGIRYWKIDIGDPRFNLVRIRKEKHIPLTLEHVHGEGPLNGDWRHEGRFGAQPWGSRRMEILSQTDVHRTYDVTSILSLPTTLDRLAEMLKGAQGHPEISALLNVEDEVYVAAALGCTMVRDASSAHGPSARAGYGPVLQWAAPGEEADGRSCSRCALAANRCAVPCRDGRPTHERGDSHRRLDLSARPDLGERHRRPVRPPGRSRHYCAQPRATGGKGGGRATVRLCREISQRCHSPGSAGAHLLRSRLDHAER